MREEGGRTNEYSVGMLSHKGKAVGSRRCAEATRKLWPDAEGNGMSRNHVADEMGECGFDEGVDEE